jgi:hypothetical protein
LGDGGPDISAIENMLVIFRKECDERYIAK